MVIIAHNNLLCAINTGIVGTIENTIFLYFVYWSFTGALLVLLELIKIICVSSSSGKN